MTPARHKTRNPMFKFSGRRPADLGVKSGKFTAPASWKPNWVSSQIETTDAHYIVPIKVTGDAKSVIARAAKLVESMSRARIIKQDGTYLYAEFSTALMGYVDDVEMFADGQLLQVRSSSRLGVRDFDVNRKRVERIRKALAR